MKGDFSEKISLATKNGLFEIRFCFCANFSMHCQLYGQNKEETHTNISSGLSHEWI